VVVYKNRFVLFFFFLVLVASFTFGSDKNVAKAQASGGPIILMGIDAEDGGIGGHGPISVYQTIVNSMLAKVTNGGSGILVIGANSQWVKDFWNEIGKGTGQSITFVNGQNIETYSFSGYAMIAICSDEYNTFGGLKQVEHDSLVKRQNDIASFVNNGGGLLGFSSDFINPYAYIGAIGNVTVNINQSYMDITPNAEGLAIGITDALDVCCWHDEYISYPSFLKVLATSPTGKAAVIGGLEIAVPSKLIVSPSNVSIAHGQQIPLSVIVDDGINKQDVTSTSTGTVYTSSSPYVVVDDNGVITLTPEAQIGDTAIITVKHNTFSASVKVTVDKPVTEVSLTEISTTDQVTLGPGEKQQLKVIATYSDGTQKDVTYATAGTTYESSMPNDILVSPNGMITISENAPFGEVGTITVKNQDKTTTVQVKISDPPIKLTVTPTSSTKKAGSTLQLKVVAEFSDGTQKDVTKNTNYMSSDTGLAIVNNLGFVTIPNTAPDGVVTIRSKYAGLEAMTTISISSVRELVDVKISPSNLTLNPGETEHLHVTAVYSDGTTEDVSSKAIYSSSNTNLVSVDAHGMLMVPDTSTGGIVYVYATYNGKTVYSIVKVEIPQLLSWEISNPSSTTITMKPGDQLQLSVTGNMSNGTTVDLTPGSTGTTYASSNTSRAMVTADGLVQIPANASNGIVYVRVTRGSNTKAITITVQLPSTPTVSSLTVNPTTVKLKPGDKQQIAVTAKMSDGSTQDVTAGSSGTVYTSSDTNRATVTADGLIEIPANASNGVVYVRATNGGKTVAVTVTIEAPTLVSWGISNPSSTTITMKPGDQLQLSVTGNMSNGTTVDLTPGSTGTTYASSNTSRAMVTADGLVQIPANASNGIVYVRVTRGSNTKAITITVQLPSTPTVSSLTVNPTTVKLKPGDKQQIAVTAKMSDGSTQDVTAGSSGTVYTSSDTNRATVTADGLIEIPANASNGVVYVRATNGGKTVAVTVTIEAPTLVSWGISNPSSTTITMKPGDQLQLSVTGNMSNGTTVDLTPGSTGTTYASSNTSRATITADGLVQIPTNASNGIVYIRVYRGSEVKAITITVSTS
jgi:trimeric autotransporter adhesin